MDAERTSADCARCRELEQRVGELEALVRSLSDRVAKLSVALEEERRRGKRQAAPFSKGPPAAAPQKPGRKSGKRHGPHAHRSVPPRIDETYDVPLPTACPHCASPQVRQSAGAPVRRCASPQVRQSAGAPVRR